MAYTGLIANALGECLSAPTNDREKMRMATCDETDSKQIFTVNGATGGKRSISSKYRNNNAGQVNTWKGNLEWSGESGRGNDIDFHFDPSNVNYPDIDKGTFKFYGWGRDGGHDAAVSGGLVTQNASLDGTPAATWMPYAMLKKCMNFGIPSEECSPLSLAQCTKYNNYLNIDCQPSTCSQSDGSFLQHQECRDWCVTNTGKCDAAAQAYCDANPENTAFCGCYNTGAFQNIKDQFATAGYAFTPRCNVTDCNNASAYKTSVIAATQCNQQVCIQNLQLGVNNESSVGGVNMACSLQNGNSPSAADTNNPPSSAATLSKGIIGTIVVVLILIFLFLATGAVIIYSQ